MALHVTRGVEAPSTLKIMEQETDACERNLSKGLAKVVEAAVSADESVILELVTNNTESALIYAKQNKLLSLRKREAGCMAESKSVTKQRLHLVHNDAPEAVDLLNEQLVELGREACLWLSILGSRSVSDFSEANNDSDSNAQKAPAKFK